MRVRPYMLLLICVSGLLSGCNLGNAGEPTPAPLTSEPQEAGRPQVTITAPSTGDEFIVDEQLFVRAQATDALGVTRVQLFANGQIVKTVSSESLEGQQALDATLDYTPRSAGQVTLRVLAFRNAIASEPSEIVIDVVEDRDDIVVTTRPDTGSGSGGSGGSGGPVIPDDGVCRALTNVGLNMRTQPTTTRDNIITTLASGTLAPIIARLGNNTWWKLSFNGRVGWVAAEFTTIYGNCQSVPIENVIVNTPVPLPTATRTSTPLPTATFTPSNTPPPPLSDLIVTGIAGEEMPIIPVGEISVTENYGVTITNLGGGVTGQFRTVMRVDGIEYDLGVVGNLNPNESIVLTQDIEFTAVGEFDIVVDVDPDGAVDEVSNVNNRGNLPVVVEAGS